jgi:hypothetical protein
MINVIFGKIFKNKVQIPKPECQIIKSTGIEDDE